MTSPYKSKYTGEQIDELLAIVMEKKDILAKMSMTTEGELMYNGYPVVLDIPETPEEPNPEETE